MLPLPSIFQSTPNMMFGNSGTSLLNNNPPSFLLPNNTLIGGNHQNGGIFSPHDNQYPDMPSMVDQYQIQPHATHYNQHFQPQFSTTQYHMMFAQPQQQQHNPHQQQHHNPHQQQHHNLHQQHQHQQHGPLGNPMSALTMPLPSNPVSNTTTIQKGKRRAPREEEKKDPNAPNTIPKCTRCNENASWRHDKRRWWCKECKKAFTPGISKMQNVQTIPQMASTQIPQTIPPGISLFPSSNPMMSPLQSQWDTSSTHNTPTSLPATIHSNNQSINLNNSVTSTVSPNCPFCKGISSWKHDKKRWYCKECRKPFTPNMLGSGSQSPSSPKKKSKTTGNNTVSKKGPISASSTPQFMNSNLNMTLSPGNLLPNHMQSPLQINPSFQGPPFSPISNPIMSLSNKHDLNLSPPRSSQSLLPPNSISHNVNNSLTSNLLNSNNTTLSSINSLNANHLLSIATVNSSNSSNSNNNNNSPIHNHNESSLSLIISSNNNSNGNNSNANNNISIDNLNNNISHSPNHLLQTSVDQNGCHSPKKSQKKKDSNIESGVQVLVNIDNTVLNPIITGDSNGVVNENTNW